LQSSKVGRKKWGAGRRGIAGVATGVVEIFVYFCGFFFCVRRRGRRGEEIKDLRACSAGTDGVL
jgi:hypothetical protein